jgi:hypothetical protein
MSLEDEYEQACWLACMEGEKRGYNPRWWMSMIRAHGAVEASVQLIKRSGGVPQSGFKRLIRMGLPKETVEFAVLRPKWRPLFSQHPDVLETARFILRQAGVTPPDEDPEEGGTPPDSHAREGGAI